MTTKQTAYDIFMEHKDDIPMLFDKLHNTLTTPKYAYRFITENKEKRNSQKTLCRRMAITYKEAKEELKEMKRQSSAFDNEMIDTQIDKIRRLRKLQHQSVKKWKKFAMMVKSAEVFITSINYRNDEPFDPRKYKNIKVDWRRGETDNTWNILFKGTPK